MQKIKAGIISNRHITGRYYAMRIASRYLGENTEPGQFFEVKCSEIPGEVLLRRPFGAHRIFKGGVEILYEAVGKGTVALSQRKAGELLDLIGPLGRGFEIGYKLQVTCNMILIAGGIGVAPLLALAEAIKKKGGEAEVLIGARTGVQVLCEKEFRKIGCSVKIATDDGSKGAKGLATDLLKQILPTINDQRLTTIYACGPVPMLKEVARLAANHRISCQVSLEERMACGVGACLGCPVKVRIESKSVRAQEHRYGYKMVCKDGPVFDAKDILW